MINNTQEVNEKIKKQKIKVTVNIILAFIFFIATVGMIFAFNIDVNYDFNSYQRKYDRYQSIIAQAEEKHGYQFEAEITSHIYDAKYNKWGFNYQVENFMAEMSSFSTPYVYDEEDINSAEFEVGKTIIIASNNTLLHDSSTTIPMSFKNVKLSDYGEYAESCKSKNSLTIATCIVGAIFLVVFIFLFPNIKKYKDLEIMLKNEHRKLNCCLYCGNSIMSGETRCRNCGAVNRRK